MGFYCGFWVFAVGLIGFGVLLWVLGFRFAVPGSLFPGFGCDFIVCLWTVVLGAVLLLFGFGFLVWVCVSFWVAFLCLLAWKVGLFFY